MNLRSRGAQRTPLPVGGGGRFGDRLQREPERVAEDVRLGYVSRRAAREQYGVVLARRGFAVDQAATRRRRSRAAAGRGPVTPPP